MTTPNPATNSENLCFITIVFPLTDNNQIPSIMGKIESALSELPKVKTELRCTSIRDKNNAV